MNQPPHSSNPRFRTSRLQHVMREVRRQVNVRPEATYREIGVRSHGRGVFHKEPVTGEILGNKRVFWLKPGTLVFNIVFAWERAVAVLSEAEAGMIGSHRFPTYEMIPGKADAKFLKYYFTTGYGHFLLELNSPGAAGRNKTLSQSALLKEEVRLPPADEQRAIADFLDRKTVAIDDLIAKKERLLALLAEKRAALIHRAVTKGLDGAAGGPTVPMKDSGVPWIGEIPAHWEVMQLRNVVRELDQGWSPSALDRSKEEQEWGVLKLSAVRDGAYRPDFHKTLPADLDPRPEFTPHLGDLLVSRANTPDMVGESCVVDQFDPRMMLCDLLYRLRLDLDRARPGFVDLFIRSASGKALRKIDARGTSHSMVKLSQGHVRSWPIPLPPPTEQAEIVTCMKLADLRYRGFVEATTASLDHLREYRQALITAAVTGQLDVDTAKDVTPAASVSGSLEATR